MRAAVQHVQHRRGQYARIHATEIAIQRNLQRLRSGPRRSQRNRKNGIRTQLALVGGAVERDHRLINQPLIRGIHPLEFRGNHGFDVGHGLQHAFAHVMALVAVAQFHGLMLAGGSARRHNGAAQCTALQNYVCFHGGVSARIQNLARPNRNNLSHISPRYTVLQPVIQFGTAIHGNGFSGSALNYSQKLMHVLKPLSVQQNCVEIVNVVPFGF